MRLKVKVYYEDTDSMGVVYYANYLRYFERGRSEYMEAVSQSVGEWNAQGIAFAVFRMNISFHKPGRLGDVCEVETTIMDTSTPFRMRMEQKLFRGEELLTEAKVQLVCLDSEFEIREFPETLLSDALSV